MLSRRYKWLSNMAMPKAMPRYYVGPTCFSNEFVLIFSGRATLSLVPTCFIFFVPYQVVFMDQLSVSCDINVFVVTFRGVLCGILAFSRYELYGIVTFDCAVYEL